MLFGSAVAGAGGSVGTGIGVTVGCRVGGGVCVGATPAGAHDANKAQHITTQGIGLKRAFSISALYRDAFAVADSLPVV
jgi:hypothetical protein